MYKKEYTFFFPLKEQIFKQAFGNFSNISVVGSVVKAHITPLQLEVRGLAKTHIYTLQPVWPFCQLAADIAYIHLSTLTESMWGESINIFSEETQSLLSSL